MIILISNNHTCIFFLMLSFTFKNLVRYHCPDLVRTLWFKPMLPAPGSWSNLKLKSNIWTLSFLIENTEIIDKPLKVSWYNAILWYTTISCKNCFMILRPGLWSNVSRGNLPLPVTWGPANEQQTAPYSLVAWISYSMLSP